MIIKREICYYKNKMTGGINNSGAYKAGAGVGRRLEMMTKAAKARRGNVINAAGQIATQSIEAEKKVKGEPCTASGFGEAFRKLLIRMGAIASDPTGKTAEAVVRQTEQDLGKARQEREEYGGPPTLPEVLIHGIGKAGNVQLTRRDLLVGKPKEAAVGIAKELGPDLLPYPLNKLAKMFGIFKWGKADKS